MQYVVTYRLKWEVAGFEHYKFTTCKKLFNVKTGNEIKKTIKGTTAGYYIDRKFITIEKLRTKIRLIKEIECPF